ncbi:MAG: acyltransferase [Bacteroidetes bacterium]|nr:acyltransferase [Bacteroidota bacterium]
MLKEMPQINLLRGIAALMVAVYHFFFFSNQEGNLFQDGGTIRNTASFGATGVYLFFVISGFVIPWSMYHGNYRLSKFFRFMGKRLLRLEPPYLVSIMLILAFGLFMSKVVWGCEWSLNVPQLLLHVGYLIPFTGGKYEWINIIYWTLAIEFTYYLVLSLLFPLLNHSNRIARYSVLLLFLAGPLILNDKAFLPVFTPIFLLGFLLFQHLTNRMNRWEMLGWAMAAFAVIAFYHKPDVVVASAIGFFGIWLLRSDTRIGNGLGAISYSLYLIHGLTGNNYLSFVASPNDSLMMKLVHVAVALVFSLVSATIFWYVVERTSKKWAQKIKL